MYVLDKVPVSFSGATISATISSTACRARRRSRYRSSIVSTSVWVNEEVARMYSRVCR